MIEYSSPLNEIFAALADPTRRDMLRRLVTDEMSINDVAFHYPISLAAVSKHLILLEQAGLITKRRDGRHHLVRASPKALKAADKYLHKYEGIWGPAGTTSPPVVAEVVVEGLQINRFD